MTYFKERSLRPLYPGSRDFSSAVSGFFQVFIVTRRSWLRPTAEDVSAFRQHRKLQPHARKTSGLTFEIKGLVSGIYPGGWNISLFYVYLQSQTKVVGKVVQLNNSLFNTQKREFFLLTNIPRPPYSMLGYNTTITPTNINVLLNTGPEAGGETKKRGENSNLPNNFDDNCSIRLFYRLSLQGFFSWF